MSKWFEKSYARLLIDNHITDVEASFMAKFEPCDYVAMVKKAGVDVGSAGRAARAGVQYGNIH